MIHAARDDRDLIECFSLIYDLHPVGRLEGGAASAPSLAESRDALRLFSRIGDAELRTAVCMLMRSLAAPPTCVDPNGPTPSAANRPA